MDAVSHIMLYYTYVTLVHSTYFDFTDFICLDTLSIVLLLIPSSASITM